MQTPKPAGGYGALKATYNVLKKETGIIRGAKALLMANQTKGFDCPGCAWPEPKKRSRFEFCENGAKAIADAATRQKVGFQFFEKHSIVFLQAQSDQWLNEQGRITHPMIKEVGATNYTPISWDAALERIANQLAQCASPNEAIFYTSGRASNEAAFLYQLMVRRFGTNNLPDCSNMCHEASGVGLSESIGIGKGTVQLSDFDKADCILVIGQNPGTNHPRMMSTLQKAARRGCEIICINPLKEAALQRFIHPQEPHLFATKGTKIATNYLPVRIGGDQALLRGFSKALMALEHQKPGAVYDHAFIDKYTSGFASYQRAVAQSDWESITGDSGISQHVIENVALTLSRSKRIIACWAMGITQHTNGVANVQEIVNLLLLGGHIGREGAGLCPVRGHSNVQGDRTMGIWESPKPAFLKKLGQVFAFESPRAPGLNTVEAIRAMAKQQAKVFFALGGNFLQAAPDTKFTAQALSNCALTVQVSTKLNKSHLFTGKGALILPCLTRVERDRQKSGEQFVSVENSMGIVSQSQGKFAPTSNTVRSEIDIICQLAQALENKSLLQGRTIDWPSMCDDYDLIRNAIEKVVEGFTNYNTRIRQPGGFSLPNLAAKRIFKTPSQRANFISTPLPTLADREKDFTLMTIRSHDQFNTTIYSANDRYRGIKGDRNIVMMNPNDMKTLGLKQNDSVSLASHYATTRRLGELRVHAYALPNKCLAMYFPEANVLIPHDLTDKKSHTPASKSIQVSIERDIDL